MIFSKDKNKKSNNRLIGYLKDVKIQRIIVGIITIIISFIIIETGAAPEKYNLNLMDKSEYDIKSPRDYIDKIKTAQNREKARNSVVPITEKIENANIDILNNTDSIFSYIDAARKSVEKSFEAQGIRKTSWTYKRNLEIEQAVAAKKLSEDIKKFSLPLSDEQVHYLVSKVSDDEINNFKKITKDIVNNTIRQDITRDNLSDEIIRAQNEYESENIAQDIKNIGNILIKGVLEPNRKINIELTEKKRIEAYESQDNVYKIYKNSIIVKKGDVINEEVYRVLGDLDLLKDINKFDFSFGLGIFLIIALLSSILVLYMNHFCKEIFHNRNDIVLICVIIVLTLLMARLVLVLGMGNFDEFSSLAIPIFVAVLLISILLDMKLAIVINFLLVLGISLITSGDLRFIFMATISGTLASFFVSKANQRGKLAMTGIVIGFVNALIIMCVGLINEIEASILLKEMLIVLLNGVLSIILTIGLLPFFEGLFNIITPLKLLELTNPNHPLFKKLLMEAPGTYHHSLMVGNLAEVATESIGGNSLLARIGAYYHDVGKLKRPGFFKENQLSENPHDRMTPNLSTLVITSHTEDGIELAKQYKIPLAIRDIISQHHGTTLVAYFYHKAKNGEKGELVTPESFRYAGPKPASKESAVVMLADSVEAAARSLPDKSEGKIEGLVRKIIKDKLDDGQLDLCDLTLRDLDNIAKGFLRVLSGYYHEREEYPEIKEKQDQNNNETKTEVNINTENTNNLSIDVEEINEEVKEK